MWLYRTSHVGPYQSRCKSHFLPFIYRCLNGGIINKKARNEYYIQKVDGE